MFTNPFDLKMNNYGSKRLDISVLYEIQSKLSFDRIDKDIIINYMLRKR